MFHILLSQQAKVLIIEKSNKHSILSIRTNTKSTYIPKLCHRRSVRFSFKPANGLQHFLWLSQEHSSVLESSLVQPLKRIPKPLHTLNKQIAKLRNNDSEGKATNCSSCSPEPGRKRQQNHQAQ